MNLDDNIFYFIKNLDESSLRARVIFLHQYIRVFARHGAILRIFTQGSHKNTFTTIIKKLKYKPNKRAERKIDAKLDHVFSALPKALLILILSKQKVLFKAQTKKLMTVSQKIGKNK